MPGGLAGLGFAPSEVARKAAFEEAGVEVTPIQMIGVLASLQQDFSPAYPTYRLLLYCRLDGGELKTKTNELDQVGFLPAAALPLPLTIAVMLAFDWHARLPHESYFD